MAADRSAGLVLITSSSEDYMRNNFVSGLVLALAAAIMVSLGNWLGLDLEHDALLGGAIGGVLGLVHVVNPVNRVIGFLVGFAFAWLGFALRAAVLPDTQSGVAVATFLVLVLCTIVAGLSAGRIPLWSTLLGTAAIVGAYENTYTNTPTEFLSQSPTAATTVLLAAAFGFLAASLLQVELTPRNWVRKPATENEKEQTNSMETLLDGEAS